MKRNFVKHKKRRSILASILSLTMMVNTFPMSIFASGNENVETQDKTTKELGEEIDVNPLENSVHSQGFELWFNPDGTTSIVAGWQGDYPVYAGEDMSAKTNKVDYNGTTYYSVQGKTNPKLEGNNPNGKVPDTGAYLKVVAPEDGTITVYGYPASGKTFYATKSDTPQITDGNAFSKYSYTVSVLKDEEWYFYAQGSKAQFAGVIFELPKADVTLPLEFLGEPLGNASILFTNDTTGEHVTVGAGDTSITLTTGYTYTVSIDSALLVIDLASFDLTGTLPQKVSIGVSSAPQHIVSGNFYGLPEKAVVTSLTYTDEAGVVSVATIKDNSYSIGLKNGNYTASAEVVGADGYTVYDHVAVVGTEGETINNDVWFYAPQKSYPTDYVSELSVGAGKEYETISEAVAAASAMNRTEGQYVTLVLYDNEYVEQVVINTPNIKLVAAKGVSPTIRWYYGIGYKYYSIDSTGYYNEKNANDKYDMHYAVKWGAVVNIQTEASGFMAEGINFVNTFNLYVADEELGDSTVGTAAEYGQSISGSLQERVSGLDVSNTTNVERAAAVVCDGDYAEFYHCSFVSSQDTLYTGTGHQYYRNCVIKGQTDYIFGNTGTNCIFDECDLVWLGYTGANSKAGYITATRGNYLFRNCAIKNNNESGYTVTPGYFGRPWGNTANVTFLYTDIQGGSMNGDSWYNMSGVNPEDATFREYGNYVDSNTSNFYYSNYATSNLTFCHTKSQAETLANPENDSTYLGNWKPVNHITKEVDLSGVDGWYVGKEEKVWKFAFFGTSTSSVANTILDGADIKNKVGLTSCTYNADGTIKKKGGKFVADSPADGASYYYTTINPKTENFYLQADVFIDYINPTPDGQEGFALMVRDTISGSGSYFSNIASVSGTKLPVDGLNGSSEVKDVIGVRNYTGIVANEDASSNSVVAYRQGFSKDVIQAGKTYRVSLEKTSSGYVSTYYSIKEDGSTGDVIGSYTMYIPAKDSTKTSITSYDELNDPMSVQEADKVYVALAVARGCNATFSNIVFTTSDWNPADWTPQQTVYVDPDYSITSPSTCAEDNYQLVFKANADGSANVYANGILVASDVAVVANEEFIGTYSIQGNTTFEVEFTPDKDFVISPYEKLSDYSTKTVTKNVTYRRLESVIYVAPDGVVSNGGTAFSDAVDIQTALSYASAGQKILLQAGTYDLSGKTLVIERGRNGNTDTPIILTTDGGYATFDFGKTGRGFTAGGDYWNMSFINITNSANGVKGMQLLGNHNTLERMNFYNNGNTGLQISGYSTETIDKWPSYNLVKNCTSINNADAGYEDADGFAAKLTVGYGNVFDGCISAYNADDGWDLFAKAGTGSIGSVTIKNSVAYRNGYILAEELDRKGNVSKFPTINCDKNGTLTFGNGVSVANWNEQTKLYGYTLVDAGNGNGFKMGGTNLPGDHKLINSISYENKAKGIDSNSCTDIKVYDSTTYNNESYNVAMYTGNKSAVTGYIADGVLSFRKDTNGKEQLAPQNQNSTDIYGENNFYWDESTKMSTNTALNQTTVSEDWFISLDTSVEPTRNADGSINMHGLLLLTDKAIAYETGARGLVWEQEENNECAHDILMRVEAVGATCEEAGNIAYWYCDECNKYFSDAEATTEIALEDTIVEATGHQLLYVEAKEPTETEAGNIAYWYCKECGKYFSDAEATTEITLEDTIISATGKGTDEEKPVEDDKKVLIHVPAKEPTETEAGNIEYWYSKEDGKYYLDAEGKKEVSADEVVISATGKDPSKEETREDDTTNTDNSNSSVPTGDRNVIGLWVVICILSLIGIAFIGIKRKKNER